MVVVSEFRRAVAAAARSPALLGLAVLLAVLRPPPAFRIVSYVFLLLALLTFAFTPVPMAALLGASDRVLREQSATAGLLETVKGRYLHLLAANALVSIAFLALNFVFSVVLVVLVAVLGFGAIGLGSVLAPGTELFGGGEEGVAAGLGLVAILGYGSGILLILLANAALDVLVRFVKPSVVVGERSVDDAIVESYRLVREFPRISLGYYAVQRAVGLLLGGLVVLATVGLFSLGSIASNPLSDSEAGLVGVLAVVLVAYSARSITYAITLPYTVNVYQYLRYVSDRAT